jgi:hypothetical protein
MRVLHWKWFDVLVIPMFVTILWVLVKHTALLEGVTGGGGTTTTTTTATTNTTTTTTNTTTTTTTTNTTITTTKMLVMVVVVLVVVVVVVVVDRGCTIVVCGWKQKEQQEYGRPSAPPLDWARLLCVPAFSPLF